MSIKEKVQNFVNEHEPEVNAAIDIATYCAFGVGMAYIGYSLGYKKAVKNGEIGLNMCILSKPELKPMLEEALMSVDKTLKG